MKYRFLPLAFICMAGANISSADTVVKGVLLQSVKLNESEVQISIKDSMGKQLEAVVCAQSYCRKQRGTKFCEESLTSGKS